MSTPYVLWWTPPRIARLRVLANLGWGLRAIAKDMETTVKAIEGQLYRSRIRLARLRIPDARSSTGELLSRVIAGDTSSAAGLVARGYAVTGSGENTIIKRTFER